LQPFLLTNSKADLAYNLK